MAQGPAVPGTAQGKGVSATQSQQPWLPGAQDAREDLPKKGDVLALLH